MMHMPVEDTYLDACEIAIFGSAGQTGSNEIEVDINHSRDGGCVIEEDFCFEAGFPEFAFNVVFFIGHACDVFVEAGLEPAEAGQTFAKFGDCSWGIGEGGDLEIEGEFILFFGVEGKPAEGDLTIGPGGGDIGASAKDFVDMSIHDGKGADIDGEDGGEEPQPVDNPGFTVREVAASDGIESAQASATDATVKAMIDGDFAFTDVMAAGKRHGSPHFI